MSACTHVWLPFRRSALGLAVHRVSLNTVDLSVFDLYALVGCGCWLWSGSVFGAFDWPVAHLALDDAGVGSQAAGAELVVEDLLGDALVLVSVSPGGKGPCRHGRCGARPGDFA